MCEGAGGRAGVTHRQLRRVLRLSPLSVASRFTPAIPSVYFWRAIKTLLLFLALSAPKEKNANVTRTECKVDEVRHSSSGVFGTSSSFKQTPPTTTSSSGDAELVAS